MVHDAKAQRLTATDDTLLAAYLIEPGRATYELDDLAAEYDVDVAPEPAIEEETADLVRRAAIPLRLIPLMRARLVERGAERLYREVELPLTGVLADMEDAGVRIDTYRMGEITARLADRVEELEATAYDLAGEEFVLGSTPQVGRILFEKLGLTPGRKGKTGYSTDTRVLRTIRHEHAIVGVIEEWREYSQAAEHVPRPAAEPDRRGRPPAHDDQPGRRVDRAARRRRTRTCRRSRSARTSAVRSAPRSSPRPGRSCSSADYSQIELRILAHVSGEPKLREAFARGDDIHTATAVEVLGKDPASLTTGTARSPR